MEMIVCNQKERSFSHAHSATMMENLRSRIIRGRSTAKAVQNAGDTTIIEGVQLHPASVATSTQGVRETEPMIVDETPKTTNDETLPLATTGVVPAKGKENAEPILFLFASMKWFRALIKWEMENITGRYIRDRHHSIFGKK